MERANVGMVQGGHGASFAFEALTEFGLRGFLGNDAVEPRIARFVDVAHAAFPDWCEDFVRTEECAGSHGHG